MKIIKKLDIYIIKSFLQLFAGTFFICLFIFVMQFLWKWMDDLIGKGLTIDHLSRFFWYSSLTLIPMSLPLAVLLASLISFGNLGERFELLSMKAAGIPLVRILAPLIVLNVLVSGGSFYFQNQVSPYATRELSRLAWSMRQKSPELEIPEGIFYSDIPGYNIFVEHKDPATGMLYGVMIYTNANGYDDTQIVLADSGRMQSTEDKLHLKLTLWGGERFRNMDNQTGSMLRASVPYMRESFIREVTLIAFDSNFNLMEADLFSGDAQAKNLNEIQHSIDSLNANMDSTRHAIWKNISLWHMQKDIPAGRSDSAKIVKEAQEIAPFDSLYMELSDDARTRAWRNAMIHAETMSAEYSFRAEETRYKNDNIRKHNIQWYKKYTMSIACLLFFFIGAPLGAIIRKGGLGVPVVTSVVIFILYYIVNQAGENNAKVGAWTIESGTWLSTIVLFATGMFLTHKANSDSVVFNIEGYRNFFMMLLGLRPSRKINRKEVIINDPDYPKCHDAILALADDCKNYSERHHLLRMPSYWRIFFRYSRDTYVRDISDKLEALIEELHNTRDNVIIGTLNQFPILAPDAHTRPFKSARNNKIAGILLPIGLLMWFRIWRYRLRLKRDMDIIQSLCPMIAERIDIHIMANEITESINDTTE